MNKIKVNRLSICVAIILLFSCISSKDVSVRRTYQLTIIKEVHKLNIIDTLITDTL